jgi:hypothetical protein
MKSVRSILVALCLGLAALGAHATMFSGFDDLERSLRLDPAQKAQFDVAVGATQRALLSVAFGGMQLKARIADELAKPRPDLDAIARAQNDVVEQSRPLFRDAHIEWARLYATLDPQQVRIAKAYVEERLEALEKLADSVRKLLADKLQR